MRQNTNLGLTFVQERSASRTLNEIFKNEVCRTACEFYKAPVVLSVKYKVPSYLVIRSCSENRFISPQLVDGKVRKECQMLKTSRFHCIFNSA